MAKDVFFDISWEDFENRFPSMVERELSKVSENISYEVAEAFQAGARNKLITRATPKTSYDRQKVIDVANNIQVDGYDDNYSIYIEPDEEGLALFLEYGTGLVGKEYPHPEASKYGWSYAINESNYVREKEYRYQRTKRGFKFKKTDTYLDENDVNPIYKHSVKDVKADVYVSYTKPHRDKRGRHIAGYERVITKHAKHYEYDQYYYDWVLSQGLKPLRYVYDTKQQISRLVNRHKNKLDGYKALKKSLKSYIKRNT